MAQNDASQDRGHRSRTDVGRYIVFGAAAGTVVFAITQEAIWIALGACLGILIAGIVSMSRRGD